MRIAIVAEVFLPKIDGVVIRTMNLIHHLQKRGDEILVVCPYVENRGEVPVPLVEFRSFPFTSYPEYRIGLPDKRLVAALDDFGPDVVHFINPFAFGFQCSDVLAKAGSNYPSLFSFHTLYGEFAKGYASTRPLAGLLWWLTREYHNRAHINLTVSSIMRDDLASRGFERVRLWPPAVDSQLFHPDRRTESMRQRLADGNGDSTLLLTVSRLAPEKNVAFLVDVMKKLPNCHLAIVGDGPQRAELEQRFQGTNSSFHGYMKGAELAEAYASADAFVYASETETMGNVVMEAMASGLCVVAPRAGGIPSLMSEGENGLLFDPRDTEQAITMLRQLVDDRARCQQLGTAARERAARCDWTAAAESVRECYQETIDHGGNGDAASHRGHWLAPQVLAGLIAAFRASAKLSLGAGATLGNSE